MNYYHLRYYCDDRTAMREKIFVTLESLRAWLEINKPKRYAILQQIENKMLTDEELYPLAL